MNKVLIFSEQLYLITLPVFVKVLIDVYQFKKEVQKLWLF